MLKLAYNSKGDTQTVEVWGQGADGNVWTKEEVTDGRRKSRNEEFRNISRMIKAKMRRAGHVACMVKTRKQVDAAEFLAEPTIVNFVQKSPCPPPHSMEPEGSLASSQKPTTVPYHEPNETSLRCMLIVE